MMILKMDNHHEDFYRIMGPYLSRREIVSELGAPVWDDDGKIWFLAVSGRPRIGKVYVEGFAALKVSGDTARLVSAYVLPDFRRRGTYRDLLNARLKAAEELKCSLVTTVARGSVVGTLAGCGFSAVKKTKNFTWMERRFIDG